MPASSSASVSGLPTTLTTLGSVFSSSRVMTAQMVPISTSASASGASAAWTVAGETVGRSPCRLTTISSSEPMICSASWMREVPLAWSARVITASPPASSMALAMEKSSVATTTRPRPASIARRQTWTIIGWPLMSASGFPGRRVEAMRAGMRTMARCGHGRNLGKTAETGETQDDN